MDAMKITEMLNKLSEEMCDNYCKWHDLIADEDELLKRCDECPLMKYL